MVHRAGSAHRLQDPHTCNTPGYFDSPHNTR